jgi:hypothetical protein
VGYVAIQKTPKSLLQTLPYATDGPDFREVLGGATPGISALARAWPDKHVDGCPVERMAKRESWIDR